MPTVPRRRLRPAGRRGLCFGLAAALAAGLAGAAAAAWHRPDPSALWHIVHDRCVPDLARFHTPIPCITVDPAAGYALLKDRNGATQVLLIPTARVTGIEDPAVLAPGTPDYFQLAWVNRGTVSALAGRVLPREDVALAVNSVFGRTQNQLHIHIDCIAPGVRAAITARLGTLGARWTRFPAPLPGGPYFARVVASPGLAGVNPFRLLARQVPDAATTMGRWTLAVVGVRLPPAGRPGFVLLAGRADPATGDVGSAERLQDHACALAHGAPQGATVHRSSD